MKSTNTVRCVILITTTCICLSACSSSPQQLSDRLIHAVESNDTVAVESVLKDGADPNTSVRSGATPIYTRVRRLEQNWRDKGIESDNILKMLTYSARRKRNAPVTVVGYMSWELSKWDHGNVFVDRKSTRL